MEEFELVVLDVKMDTIWIIRHMKSCQLNQNCSRDWKSGIEGYLYFKDDKKKGNSGGLTLCNSNWKAYKHVERDA